MAIVDANYIPQLQRKSKVIPVRCRFCARPVANKPQGSNPPFIRKEIL